MNIGPNLTSLSPEAIGEPWDKGGATLGASRHKSDLTSSRFHALRFVAGFSVVVIASASAWPYLPRRYEATTTITLHPTDLESSSNSVQFMRHPLDENAVQSEIDQIASPKLAAVVIAQHSLAADPEFAGRSKLWFLLGAVQGAVTEADLRQRLLKHLSVSKDRHSYTVKFGFMSSDPVKSAALTDTLLKAYLADQLARKREKIDAVTAWLRERVDLLRAKSDASQRAVKDFLTESGLIDTGARSSLEQQLSTLSSEEALAKSRTFEAQARAEALSDLQKAGKLDAAPEVLASPVIQKLKEAVTGARSSVALVDTPQRAFDQQVAVEAERILRAAKTEAAVAMAREVALQHSIKTIRDEIMRRQYSELRLDVLRRDAASDRTALDDALVRLAGQTARADAVTPDVDVIDPPEAPIYPAFPNPVLAFLGSLLAACLTGAAMVWRPLSLWARRISTNVRPH